ncbi:MAG: PKD domain-containing protein [Candidatus Thermoplasmatota archaeon]|nr:PKD domain-containing protein [Candidatus Thermoplasmatota archaeon]
MKKSILRKNILKEASILLIAVVIILSGVFLVAAETYNNSPNTPNLTGETSGKPGTEYEYTFVSTDPEGDNIEYCLDWGDNTGEICIGPYVSGVEASAKHTWTEKGNYVLKVKARDINGAESEWKTLSVSMAKNKVINIPLFLQRFFQCFPFFEKILNQ